MINNNNRTFGFELEFVGIKKDTFREVLKQQGFPVRISKTIDGLHYWKLVDDRSLISHNKLSGELVSPILCNQSGLDQAKAVVSLLKNSGASVNATCGLHVHVSVRDFKLFQLKKLVERYADKEDEIDKRMEEARRGNNNKYCLSMREMLKDPVIGAKFARANTKTRIADSFNTRYLKMNLKSLALYDTVEFRQHHATLKSTEVISWIEYCVNFVEESRAI